MSKEGRGMWDEGLPLSVVNALGDSIRELTSQSNGDKIQEVSGDGQRFCNH